MLLVPVLLVPLLTACADDGEPSRLPAPEGVWVRGADLPLTPRTSPQVGWTGTEVLVVGGDVGVPTDPASSGPSTEEFAADGAAYDPDADTWRPIADAPEPIPYFYRSTMVGDTMVVQSVGDDGRSTGWLSYDAGDDTWTRLPDPPAPATDHGSISASDGRVVAMTRRGVVMVLDVASSTWSVLPSSEISRDEARSACVVATQGPGLVVSTGTTSYVWDGSRWSVSVVEGCWRHWTGRRLVDERRWYDPATGQSAPLPGAPDVENDPLPPHVTVNAAAGPLVAAYGYVYDDDAGSWTPFGTPVSDVDRDTGATWVGRRLVVVGGLDQDAGYQDTSGLSAETWVWQG